MYFNKDADLRIEDNAILKSSNVMHCLECIFPPLSLAAVFMGRLF